METFKIQDGDFDGWIGSIQTNPVLGPEYAKMLEMHRRLELGDHRLVSPDVRFGRLYQEVYEPSDLSIRAVVRGLRMAAARLRTFDRLLLVEHAPKEFMGRLTSESRVAHTFSPIDLIDTAFNPRGTDRLSRRRQLEAIMRKGVPLVQQVDKRGLTIIALTPEDLATFEEAFQVAVSIAPFLIRELPHGRPETVVDPTNPYSSLDFKARRYELDFRYSGAITVPVEANLQLGQHYADTIFSRTQARHSVYRLNQLCDQYFPFRFPRFMCGVDFREGSARRKKMLHKLW